MILRLDVALVVVLGLGLLASSSFILDDNDIGDDDDDLVDELMDKLDKHEPEQQVKSIELSIKSLRDCRIYIYITTTLTEPFYFIKSLNLNFINA